MHKAVSNTHAMNQRFLLSCRPVVSYRRVRTWFTAAEESSAAVRMLLVLASPCAVQEPSCAARSRADAALPPEPAADVSDFKRAARMPNPNVRRLLSTDLRRVAAFRWSRASGRFSSTVSLSIVSVLAILVLASWLAVAAPDAGTPTASSVVVAV